jgi:hypothetical protein
MADFSNGIILICKPDGTSTGNVSINENENQNQGRFKNDHGSPEGADVQVSGFQASQPHAYTPRFPAVLELSLA